MTEQAAEPPTPVADGVRSGLVEPVLDMTDIQGIAVPGFLKPHQTLVYLRFPGTANDAALRAALREVVPSTAEETLLDRRAFRASASVEESQEVPPLIAIGFTAEGLRRLTPGAVEIDSPAYQLGLAARSRLLGDPTKASDEGHPSKWVVGKPGDQLDALVVVAGSARRTVDERAQALMSLLGRAGIGTQLQNGDTRGDVRGREHFGFDDGVSQPGIRGRASGASDDFVTDRWIDASEPDASWRYGRPGQDLIWPGELVLGYPASAADPHFPGAVAAANPPWARNGSFLVYRRLRQDVGLFWRTMRSEAERLSGHPGFEGLTDDRLAALLIGRWPSGAPVSRVPGGDLRDLGHDDNANNNFEFDSDSRAYRLRVGADAFPLAKADPLGAACPLGAHIRKMNTREAPSDVGGRMSTYSRRLLRVGVPFGPPLEDRYGESRVDPAGGDRGLLFLSIQASIEQQFEFLQARWANDPSRPKAPGGNDMIIGQNAAAEGRTRRCTLFGSGLQQATVEAKGQWVVPTGGGYFFVPSLSALRDVILG